MSVYVQREWRMGQDPAVQIWVGAEADALDEYLRDSEGSSSESTPGPSFSLSEVDAQSLVFGLLRGPSGPPGPTGPAGASA